MVKKKAKVSICIDKCQQCIMLNEALHGCNRLIEQQLWQ